jgi:hypothetical protein
MGRYNLYVRLVDGVHYDAAKKIQNEKEKWKKLTSQVGGLRRVGKSKLQALRPLYRHHNAEVFQWADANPRLTFLRNCTHR